MKKLNYNFSRKTAFYILVASLVSGSFLNGSLESIAEEETDLTASYESDHGFGYIDAGLPYTVPYAWSNSDNSGFELLRTGPESYYNSYELGKLPAVRDQGEEGACWAFTSMGAVEADLINDDDFSADSIDLSELQLAYYTSHNYDDPKDCHDGDTRRFVTSNPNVKWLSNGGNCIMAYRAMINGVGVIDERFMPYIMGDELDGYTPNEKYALGVKTAQLKGTYIINIDQKTEIKNAVKQHGGIATSIYFDEAYGRQSTYNSTNHYAYRYNGAVNSNHGVLIVGWDDDFDKNNFKEACRPENNGAWLVRNSWGYEGYGMRGYLWISYEDTSIGGVERAAYVFDADTNIYENTYSYIGNGFNTGMLNNITEVMVDFNVKGGEKIKAVGFETGSNNFTADVTVSDGTNVLNKSIETTFAGFYTVEFDEELLITEDKKVNVVISFSTPVRFITEPSGLYNTSNSGFFIRTDSTRESTTEYNESVYDGFMAKQSGYSIYSNCQFDPAIMIYTNNSTESERVTGVTLDRSTVSVRADESVKLNATVSPESALDKDVCWVSADTGIATVDSQGNVTGVAPGNVVITAITDDGGFTASCNVTVTPSPFRVSGVTLDKNELNLYVGDTAKLTATVSPSTATNKRVSWISYNTDAVTVDASGNLTAVGEGGALIRATTEDGEFEAECNVYVRRRTVSVSGIRLNNTSVSVDVGQYIWLEYEVLPDNATNKNVTITSSNSEAVYAPGGDRLTSCGYGRSVITVETEDGGFSASFTITVEPPRVAVTGISLDKNSLSLKKGEATTLTATVSPTYATDKSIRWTSSDAGIAGVDSSGKVTAVSAGSARITATTVDGGYTASCNVTVIEPENKNENNTNNNSSSNNSESNNSSNNNNASNNDGNNTIETDNSGKENKSNSESKENNTNKSDNNNSGTENKSGNKDTGNKETSNKDTDNNKKNDSGSVNNDTDKSKNNESEKIDNGQTDIGKIDNEKKDEEKKTNPYEEYGLDDKYVPDGYVDESGSPMIVEGKDLDWNVSNEKSYWYEGGIKQGTYYDPKGVIGDGTNRGREICDNNIKDENGNGTWFWLDSCYDGAKAVGKEVWVPYIYQQEDEWDDETKHNIAFESDEGMGDCVLNAIRGKAGKWVRYDENGRMLKGWVTIEGALAGAYPVQAGNTYYYDTRTGLMAKGWVTLNGQAYFFDEISGVLVP